MRTRRIARPLMPSRAGMRPPELSATSARSLTATLTAIGCLQGAGSYATCSIRRSRWPGGLAHAKSEFPHASAPYRRRREIAKEHGGRVLLVLLGCPTSLFQTKDPVRMNARKSSRPPEGRDQGRPGSKRRRPRSIRSRRGRETFIRRSRLRAPRSVPPPAHLNRVTRLELLCLASPRPPCAGWVPSSWRSTFPLPARILRARSRPRAWPPRSPCRRRTPGCRLREIRCD